MKRTLPALFCLLLLAAPAEGKQISSAKVCGAAGECREFKDPEVAQTLDQGGRTSDPPRMPTPWYRVEFTVEHGGQADSWYIAVMPAAGYVRYGPDEGPYDWAELSPEGARRYRNLTAGIEGRPATTLRGRLGEPVKARVDSVWRAPAEDEEGSSSAAPLLLGGFGAAGALALGGLAFRRIYRRPRVFGGHAHSIRRLRPSAPGAPGVRPGGAGEAEHRGADDRRPDARVDVGDAEDP